MCSSTSRHLQPCKSTSSISTPPRQCTPIGIQCGILYLFSGFFFKESSAMPNIIWSSRALQPSKSWGCASPDLQSRTAGRTIHFFLWIAVRVILPRKRKPSQITFLRSVFNLFFPSPSCLISHRSENQPPLVELPAKVGFPPFICLLCFSTPWKGERYFISSYPNSVSPSPLPLSEHGFGGQHPSSPHYLAATWVSIQLCGGQYSGGGAPPEEWPGSSFLLMLVNPSQMIRWWGYSIGQPNPRECNFNGCIVTVFSFMFCFVLICWLFFCQIAVGVGVHFFAQTLSFHFERGVSSTMIRSLFPSWMQKSSRRWKNDWPSPAGHRRRTRAQESLVCTFIWIFKQFYYFLFPLYSRS